MSRSRHQLLPPGAEKLAVRQGEAAATISLSEEKFKNLRQKGLMPPARDADGVILYITEELKLALYALPVVEDEEVAKAKKAQAAKDRWRVE